MFDIIKIVFNLIGGFIYTIFIMMIESAMFATMFFLFWSIVASKLGLPHFTYLESFSIILIIKILKFNLIPFLNSTQNNKITE
jgi:hypothetical protein